MAVFTYKNGFKRFMSPKMAKVLQQAGRGTYEQDKADLTDKPEITKDIQQAELITHTLSLEEMTKHELVKLAQDKGLKVTTKTTKTQLVEMLK